MKKNLLTRKMRLTRRNRAILKRSSLGKWESYIHLDEVLDTGGKWYAQIMRQNGKVP